MDYPQPCHFFEQRRILRAFRHNTVDPVPVKYQTDLLVSVHDIHVETVLKTDRSGRYRDTLEVQIHNATDLPAQCVVLLNQSGMICVKTACLDYKQIRRAQVASDNVPAQEAFP